MRKLTLAEKKIFQYIDNNIDIDAPNTKSLVIKLLKDNFGFTSGEALKFFINWYYSSGYDYETYELDEDKNPLFDFIQTISTITTRGELDYFIDELYDKDNILYRRLNGEYFNIACQYSGNIPCLNFDLDGITIELDSQNWEEYFSGLYEDDWWRYYESHSNYSDNYEDFESDEFNYMSYNDDTIDILGDIATLSGKLNWPGKDGGATRSEDISKFLSEVLPSNYFEEVVNEYLSELSYVVSDNRRKATRDYYEEEVKYDTNQTRCEFAHYCIHIPYSDLLDIIDGEDLLSLSDLKDVGVNGTIDLGDVWYDTYTVSGDNEKLAKEFNYILERVIKRIVEKDGIDLEEVNRIKEKVVTMLDTLNLEKGLATMTGHWYDSEDGKIRLHTDDIDFKENKISFWYNKKRHKVPIDEFPNWVMGSVMDLQESFKNKKKLIKEQRENITKISIFDFDGTLMDTPNAEEGKKEWEEFTGEVYPHKGWWSKPESLDDAVFDIQPIPSTVEDYKIEMDNPNALVIMLTGRLPRQSDQVEELLSMHDLYFDEYHYKNNGDTLSSKLNTIHTLLNRYPNVTNIEMWEDRVAHVSEFEKFGDEINTPIKVNFVGGETEIITESVDKTNYYQKLSELIEKPYFYSLYSMGVEEGDVENIVKLKFDEPVNIYMPDIIKGTNIPFKFVIKNEEGKIIYFEELKKPNDTFIPGLWEEWTYTKVNGDHQRVSYENSVQGKIPESSAWDNVDFDDVYGNINESEDREWLLYKKVSDILKPPFIKTLEGMGFDLTQSEKILYKFFGERVYIYDDSATNHYGEVIDPDQYWVMNEDGKKVYEEEDDWWAIWKYDEDGKTIYYEDSYAGVVNLTDRINESTEENTTYRTIDFFANDMFSKTTINDQYWGVISPYGLRYPTESFENIPYDIVFRKSKMIEETPNANQRIYLYHNYGIDDTALSKEIIIKYYRLIGNYIDNQNNQINESTEKNRDRLYDRVLGILNEPPYVGTLLSMGFNMFQIEEILKLKFQKENIKLDIRSHHNTSTERDFKDLVNGEHWLETNVNVDSGRGWENIYFENMHGQWIISRYDKNGNQTYYENWVGFWWKREYNDRGDLISYEDSNGNDTPIEDLGRMNESTEKTTLYDRMLPLMKRPYVDFLKKNGFDWDMIESQFEKMYGEDIKQDHYEYIDGTWDYRVRTIGESLLYYETTKESVIPYWEEVKYPNEKEVWFMDKYDRAWVKKYNDDGKLIFSYGKHSDTWEDSPEEIKNDPFFDKDGTDILNESTEKNVVDNYLMKVAQMIKKPYVYHIKQHSIDRGYYKQILSYIFNKDIHLDISFGQYNVYDPDNGNRIYSEFNDKDGWEYTEL